MKNLRLTGMHLRACTFLGKYTGCRFGNESEKDESDDLREEAELASKLGFEAEFVKSAPLVNRPAIRFANQARFHPLKFIEGLSKAIDGGGCAIHELSEVTEVAKDPLAVKCGEVSIECDYVVIATHVPLMGKSGYINATLLQTRLIPQSTYVIGAKAPKGSVPDASFGIRAIPIITCVSIARRGTTMSFSAARTIKRGRWKIRTSVTTALKDCSSNWCRRPFPIAAGRDKSLKPTTDCP